ncbi:palmitoleoyl-protein carboxylesterase NOTUM [Microplitis mediator]|uniref:palmitoleoyl-protein carboxylesterase NOTUM n=1 Tax=Microplitis mediator TaxID=375433 RepID=UPI0025522EC3|nr:palmitoleoyl-protein carboxylesterase NOTUM [Microplitis mediator]
MLLNLQIAVCLVALAASVSAEDKTESAPDTVSLSPAPASPITQSNTIQKLRKILEKNDQEEPRELKRVSLSNRFVTCNDGSQAGFYYRKSVSKKWIVFLEGGWCCFDYQSCRHRWANLRNFMTSTNWSDTREVGGILSPNPRENPHWWSVNHVYIPYCTSDSWSGTRKHIEGFFSFLGAEILLQVIRDLMPLGLDTGTSLMLAGSSAGGTGVMLNLDRVKNLIHNDLGKKNIVVRGISDSGWFLDREPYAPNGGMSPVETVRMGMELWDARMPDNCVAQYPDEPWRCFFGYRLYPSLTAPLFIFQWLFDKAQMKANNVGTPMSKEQWNYIHKMGDSLRQTFDNVTAVFAPSCISHNVLTIRDWQMVKIDQVSLPQALHCWEKSSPHRANTNNTQVETNQSCGKSITNPSLRTNQTKKNTTVTSATSGNNDNNRNDDDTGVDIKQNINLLGRKNRVKMTMGNNSNGPINGRGNKKRKRRRKHKDNKRLRERNRNGKNRERKDKRQRRKEGRKQNNNKYISGNNHRTILNDTRPQRSLLSGGNRRERTCADNNCQHRHIERCTWPQCNHSCPKLHNPFTGEEMDFIELLKSFGLDMKSVANALGIDIHTLNNMNHAELLNLLTQQAN